jgi:hypothetical protein
VLGVVAAVVDMPISAVFGVSALVVAVVDMPVVQVPHSTGQLHVGDATPKHTHIVRKSYPGTTYHFF